jgi:hypothetical protein
LVKKKLYCNGEKNVFNYFAFVYFTGKNEVILVDDSMEQKLYFLSHISHLSHLQQNINSDVFSIKTLGGKTQITGNVSNADLLQLIY